MLMTGIMGLYIGRIHAEVKRRPLYVVSQRLGFEREPKQVRTLLSASAD
jgi:dolichol-phosphate mannosyltransferase